MKEFYFEEAGIYYRTNELKENRPTFVFVHGLSGSSSAWLPYEKKFKNEYNILSLDLRGHGKSLKHKHFSDYEMKKLAGDISSLVRLLNLSNIILVSHSFGTLVALEYLALLEGRASMIVFLSPSYNVGKSLSGKFIKPFLHLSKVLSLFPFRSLRGKHIDYDKYRNTGDWNVRRMFTDIKNTSLRVYLYSTLQSYSVDKKDFLSNINIPTLIMHGEKDTIFPIKNSLTMSENIKNCQLVIVPNSNHILPINNISEVTSAMESFLERNLEML